MTVKVHRASVGRPVSQLDIPEQSLTRPNGQKEAKDGSLALKPGWKVLKYFSDQASGRRWLWPVGDSSGPSSSSSSDSDESSSSSWSSSLSSSENNWMAPASFKKSQRLSQKKHWTKKKKKKKEPKKKKSTGRKSSYRGTDPSTGDDKRIHGFEVAGVKIDKALAPPDLAARDRISLVETAVDDAALPGMISASSLALDEVQGVTEAATSMLATILGKRAQLHNSQWKVMRKNSLGNVKTDTDLLALLESVEETWVPANEQQANMYRCMHAIRDSTRLDLTRLDLTRLDPTRHTTDACQSL
jgi:hypothetical protein